MYIEKISLPRPHHPTRIVYTKLNFVSSIKILYIMESYMEKLSDKNIQTTIDKAKLYTDDESTETLRIYQIEKNFRIKNRKWSYNRFPAIA